MPTTQEIEAQLDRAREISIKLIDELVQMVPDDLPENEQAAMMSMALARCYAAVLTSWPPQENISIVLGVFSASVQLYLDSMAGSVH